MSYSIYDLNNRISNIQGYLNILGPKLDAIVTPPNSHTLQIVDTILVGESTTPLQTVIIEPNLITCSVVGDTHETHIDNTHVHIIDNLTLDEMFIDHNSLILVQPSTTHQTELLGTMLDFQTPQDLVSCGHETYQDGRPGFEVYDLLTGVNSLLTTDSLRMTGALTTNTLDSDKWSGQIQTVNTGANATHYLNFSDASTTGYGKPQKTVGISCNPSTNTVTATTFVGALSGNSSSSTSVAVTSDNTAGTYFIPFSKTVASNSVLYVDNASGPLTYNPASSILTSSFFNGAITLQSTQNVATYAGTTLSVNGSYFSVNVSFMNSSITFTGAANAVNTLSPINMVVGGRFKVGILNSGTGNLTFNTGLGANIKTVYSSNVQIPTLRYGCMSIDVISINAVTTYIVNVSVLTN